MFSSVAADRACTPPSGRRNRDRTGTPAFRTHSWFGTRAERTPCRTACPGIPADADAGRGHPDPDRTVPCPGADALVPAFISSGPRNTGLQRAAGSPDLFDEPGSGTPRSGRPDRFRWQYTLPNAREPSRGWYTDAPLRGRPRHPRPRPQPRYTLRACHIRCPRAVRDPSAENSGAQVFRQASASPQTAAEGAWFGRCGPLTFRPRFRRVPLSLTRTASVGPG